jgi:hypothetical protein
MMNVAHHYAKCYWNASGEFDCGQGRVAEPIPDGYAEVSHRQKGTCGPCANKNPTFSQIPQPLSPQYANYNRPQITESYRNPPPSAPSKKYNQFQPRFTGKTDDLDPLNREMEISIYVPDRDSQFPWQRENEVDGDSGQDYLPNYGHGQEENNQELPPNQNRQKQMAIDNRQPPNPQLQQREMTEHLVRAPPNDPNLPNQQQSMGPVAPQLIQVMQPKLQIPKVLQWSQKSKYFSHFEGKVNKYYFQLPYQKYYELIEEFGQPKLVNMNKGGIAIWQKSAFKNTSYHFIRRIDLIDEQCFNSFPVPHVGFLYTHVKMEIPMTKIASVISMCGDVMYDPIKKIFIVRGMSLYYNLAIIALICLFIYGQLTWYQITEGDLIRKSLSYKQLTNRKSQERNLRTISKYLTPGKINELKI